MAHEEEVEDVNIRLRQDEELDFFTELALHETERWIQAVTRKKFQYPDDFRKSLENGVLLCELVNCLKPGSVKRINKLPTPIAGLDNINVFQKACRENFSLSNAHLFDVCDLEDLTQRAISESEDILKQEQDRRARNVAITVYWIARSVSNSNNNNVPQLDFSAFSALVHQKELTPDPVESRHDSWDSADLSSAYSSHESTSRGLQGDGITARHVRDSSYDSFGSLSNSRDSELSFTEDSHRDNQHNNEDNMPMSRDFSNSMSNLSRHHGFSTVGDNNDMYRSTPDLQNSHTRTSSTDSYEGSHHNHSRQSSDSGTVEIPTRVLSGARKTSTSVDPFAFVNISKQNQLAQIAKEQIKISEETKSIRKPSENELGDWQSNFTDWKNKRRRRSEATLHRVEESERLGQEMEDQKKTKTFSEMMEEKKSRRKSTPILSYPIDDDDELFVSAPHVTETMKRVLPIAEEPVSRRPAPKLNLANKSKSTGVLPVSSLNTQKEEKHAPWLEDKKTTKSSPKGDNSSDNKENSVKNHNSVRDQNGVQSNKDSKNSNKISAKVLSRFSTDSPVTNTSSAKNSSAHQGVPTGKISNIRSNFESKEKEAHVDYRQPKQSFNFRAETRQKHPHHSPTSSWSAVEKVESRAPRTEITKHTKPVPTEAFVDKIIKISQKPNNAKGFGFTFTGGAQNPCKITKVSLGSGADLNDLLVGDTIMSINRKDVTSSIMTTSLIQKTIDDANRLGQIELHVRRVICEKDENVFSDEFEDEEEETAKSPVSLPSALAPKKPSPTSHKPSQPPPVSSKPERSRLSRDETTPTRSAGNIDKSPIIVTAEHVIPVVTPLQRLAEFHARQDEDIKLIPRKETNNNEIGTSGSQKEAVDLPKEREMSPGPNEPVVIERVSIQHSELPVKSTTTELSAPSKETKPYSRNLISEEQKREITEDVLVPSSTEKVNSVPPPYQEIMMERPTISHSREVEHLSKAPESQTYKTESVIDVYSKPSVEIISNARDSPPQVQYSPPPPLPPEEPEDENGGPPAILKRWQKRTSRPTSSASSLDSTNDRSSTSSIPLWENSYSANNTSDLSPLVNEPFPAAKVGQEVTVEIPMINQPQLEQLVIDPRNQVSPGSSSLPQYNFHVNIGSKGLSADEAIEQERQRVQEETERRLDQEKLQSEEQRKVEEEEERKKEEMKKKEEELRKMEELLRLQSERLQKEKEEFERQKNQRNMEPKTTQPVFNVRQNFSPHDSDNGASRKVDKWNPPVEPLATRSKTTLTREDMLAMNRKATPLQRKPEVDPNEMKGSDSAPASREAPSRQEIHSLNAVPKPRYRSSQDWISDSGVNSHVSHKPESHNQHHGDASVHSHWMVEEAERRRKADSDRMSPKHFSSHGHRPKNEAALSNRWREDNVIPKQQFQSHSPSSLPRNLTTPGGHPHTYPHHHPQPHHQANHSSPAALHPQSHSINSSLSPHREPHRPSRGSSSSSSSLPSPSSPLNSSGDLMAVSGKQGCSHCHQELGFGAAMVIESLGLYYHVQCFKCCVCRTALGNGSQGADVRVRGNKLHCRNCYSNDEGTRGGRSSS